MAYSSRSSRSSGRSSGRSGGGRGGRAAPRGSGGGSAATVGAILLVVGAIAALIAFSSKGKDKPTPAQTPRGGTQPAPPTRPPEPQRPPPPPLDESLKAQAKALADEAKVLAQQGEAIYAEAMAAKEAGNQDLWQSKLKEAAEPYQQILSGWNDLIVQMPTDLDNGWDEEEVANYHLGKEGDTITRALGRLSDIRKQIRLH